MEMIDTEQRILQKESIKINHNTKGYTWEIKVFIEDKDDSAAIQRLGAIDTQLSNQYGMPGGKDEMD